MKSKPAEERSRGESIIAICGNPNSGKTTIFNAITGLSQKVANYPGVTVERVSGQFSLRDQERVYTLVDIPGAYSLSPFSPDEQIAADVLGYNGEGQQSAIICAADATQLERGLYMVLQLLQYDKPIVVALTMVDLLESRGMTIDCKVLSAELGSVPVVQVVAPRGRGIEILKRESARAVAKPSQKSVSIFSDVVEKSIEILRSQSADRKLARGYYLRVLFDRDGASERHFLVMNPSAKSTLDECRAQIASHHRELSLAETEPLTNAAGKIAAKVITSPSKESTSTTEKIDRWLLHPILGPLVLVAVMAFMFQSIFSWAQPFMEGIDTAVSWLGSLVTNSIPIGPLHSLIEDGIIGGVGAVLVFIPQIVILFVGIAILEDSGYITRAAFIVDRLFRFCGLSGKSFIPMLSSFACAIPGIMATRTIENRSQRFLTILVAPLMTCSARLPVYTIMISAFIPMQYYGPFNLQGLTLSALYLLGIVIAVIVALILKKTMFRSQQSTFMMELPAYRMPTIRSVVTRVVNRVKAFVIRAGTIIMAIAVVVWALSYFPHSDTITATWTERIAAEDQAFDLQKQSATGAAYEELEQGHLSRVAELEHSMAGDHVRNSWFGRIGRTIEPLFEPLGWDWRISMAALASFPAREVVVAVLGTTFNLGTSADDDASRLTDKLRGAKWESGDKLGLPLFSPAVALSIMVFFALCCQCGATLVTIRQETASWWYASFAFVYMTTLAWLMAFITFRVFNGLGF
jgi:ferrous iron transport protein B